MVTALRLNSGQLLPQIGLGTWKSASNAVGNAVRHALRHGYRHIDCASIYGNEAEIGEAFREVFQEGTVRREDVFITSKLFNNCHTPQRAKDSLDKTLKDLQLQYLDLYLMHWPVAFRDFEIPQPMRLPDGTPSPKLDLYFEYLDTWTVLEEFVASGKVKAIGVSNFTIDQLRQLIAHSKVGPPVVNQVEFHPYLVQTELHQFCKENGIVLTAYSPLGSPDSYSGQQPGAPALLKEPIVLELAKKHNKSPAQILLRWSVQMGTSVIPKSVTPSRIEENLQIFDFKLSEEDVSLVSSLNRNHRFGFGWLPGHYLPTKGSL